MRRLAIAFVFLGLCTGAHAADMSKIRKIGIVSFVPNVFHLEYVGFTVFDNKAQDLDVSDWNANATIVKEAARILSPQYQIVPVSYDPATFADIKLWSVLDSTPKEFASLRPAEDVDAYLIFVDGYEPFESLDIAGMGRFRRGMLFSKVREVLHADFTAYLVDAHDLSRIHWDKSEKPDPSIGDRRVVTIDDPTATLSDAERADLRSKVTALLVEEVDATLPELKLVTTK